MLDQAWNRAMLDTTPDLICLVDRQATYRSVNRAYAAAFGLEPEDMVGRQVTDVLPTELCLDTLHENMQRCLAGQRVDFGIWLAPPQTGMRYWSTTYMPFCDDSGAAVGVLVHCRDDTQRQEALEETRSKGQIIHDTLESMHQGLLMLDSEGRVTLFNERLFELMDLPRDFFDTHKTFDDVLRWWRGYHGLDDAWLQKARKRSMRQESLRFEIPGPAGTTLEVRHRPLRQGGFVRTFTDVTQRVESELALKHAQEQLEYLVEVRTRELQEAVEGLEREVAQRKQTERALLEARNAAQSASEAKTQFLANMSHELRTPLNGILGVAQLLLASDLDDANREYVEIMRQSSNDLLHLLNDILELASIEQGSTELKSVPFLLREALTPLLRTFETQAKGRGLRFHSQIHDKVPDVLKGDVERLTQVLFNLLGNAMKFTEKGSISLSVRLLEGPGGAAARERAGENAVALFFTVQDTGIGIAESRQEHVFERFLLGEDFLTKRFGGSGIGLSIARELIDMMQGRIWLESEPGEGTTFYFWVPLLEESEEELPAEHPMPSLAEVAGQDSATASRILVVEDEPVNRLFLQRALERMGYVSLVAENGRRALELLAEEPVDLVLMDVQMPDVNGLDATRRIRSGEVAGVDASLPVLGLTAYAMSSDREKGFEVGMDGYLAKPCNLEDLREGIEALLQPAAMS